MTEHNAEQVFDGLAYAVANELTANDQVPHGMALMSALSAVAAVGQDLIDVELPSGGMVPTSLSTLVVAGSGEGKSIVDRVVFRVLREHEASQREVFALAQKSWEAETETWQVVYKHLKSQLKAAVKNGDAADASEALHQHVLTKPAMPQGRRLLYADVTMAALLAQMSQKGASAVLQSSEGATILSGAAASHLQYLCSMWSGETVTVDRVTSESFVLEQPRLTAAIMIQPVALDKFLREHGEEARGLGFLARFIVCAPPSTQGMRTIGGRTLRSTAAIEVFEQRLKTLLRLVDERVDAGGSRQVVRMSPDACSEWAQYYNIVEYQKQPGGVFCMAHDHAARLAENVARVAALMHLLDGRKGDIDVQSVRSAIQLCGGLSNDFMRVFVPPPPEELWAYHLDEYLERYRVSGTRFIKLSDLMKSGPRSVRKKDSLHMALQILNSWNRARLCPSERTMMVDLMPWLPWAHVA